MSKIYKATIYLIALIALAFVGKVIKLTFFENTEISFDKNNYSSSTLTTYQNIKLGTTAEELLYLKGNPVNVSNEITDINDERYPKELKDEKPFMPYILIATNEELEKNNYNYKKYNVWEYKNGVTDTTIFFDTSNNVKEIGCAASGVTPSSEVTKFKQIEIECEFKGVSLHTTEEELIKKLGTPTKQSYEGTSKVMDYKNLTLQVRLEKSIIYYISVRNDL